MEQTRSRPYRKNDQATVESRNNHVVRRHAFYYRYEPPELDLLNELWELVRRVHAIQDQLEDMALPRTRRLEKRLGPDMAYLDRTLARITGVRPEDHNNDTPADTD